MSNYADLAADERDVLARTLKGTALNALIVQCVEDGDVEMLEALHGAGRFRIEPSSLVDSHVRKHPVLHDKAYGPVDALGSVLAMRSSIWMDLPTGRSGTPVQPILVTAVDISDRMRALLREVTADALDQFRTLRVGRGSLGGLVPALDRADVTFVDLQAATLSALEAIACGINDAALARMVRQERLTVANRDDEVLRLVSALRSVDSDSDNNFKELGFYPVGWACRLQAVDVLRDMMRDDPNLLNMPVGSLKPREESWADLDLYDLIKMANMVLSPQMLALILDGMRDEAPGNSGRPARNQWVRGTLLSNLTDGTWSGLTSTAIECGAIDKFPFNACNLAVRDACPPVLRHTQEHLDLPSPQPGKSFDRGHAVARLLEKAGMANDRSDTDACMLIVLQRMQALGRLGDALLPIQPPERETVAHYFVERKLHGSLAWLAEHALQLPCGPAVLATVQAYAEDKGQEEALAILRSTRARQVADMALQEHAALGLGS